MGLFSKKWLKDTLNTVTLGASSGFKKNPLKTAGNAVAGGLLDDSGAPKKITGISDKIQKEINANNELFDNNLSRGQEMYKNMIGGDNLKNMMDARSDAKKEISDRRRDLSRGLSAQENQAARAQFESQMRRAGASSRSQLAANMASRGLSGGVASGQAQNLENSIADRKVDFERDLMLKNIDMKRQGLGDYENTVGSQEGEAMDQLYNKMNLAVATGQQAVDQKTALSNMYRNLETARLNRKREYGIF